MFWRKNNVIFLFVVMKKQYLHTLTESEVLEVALCGLFQTFRLYRLYRRATTFEVLQEYCSKCGNYRFTLESLLNNTPHSEIVKMFQRMADGDSIAIKKQYHSMWYLVMQDVVNKLLYVH